MIRFLLLHLFLVQSCFCQLKQCYNIHGDPLTDLPCDPSANVSACCGQNFTCWTNFYCSWNNYGAKLVGSCTDKTWHDPACPLPLNTGEDQFDYTLNTTACDDGTYCPHSGNTTCCFNHQGIIEIDYHYDAPLPTIAQDLGDYYTTNGYHVPTIESSLSDTLSTNNLSVSASAYTLRYTAPSSPFAIKSSIEPTTPPSTSATASQIKPMALPSTSAARPPTHQTTSSGLRSSTKAGLGAGVTVGISTIGLLLYFLIRQLRRRPRRDLAHVSTLRSGEVTQSGSKRYEKPELTGEDARRELDAAERRRAELNGVEPRMEMAATPAEHRVVYEL